MMDANDEEQFTVYGPMPGCYGKVQLDTDESCRSDAKSTTVQASGTRHIRSSTAEIPDEDVLNNTTVEKRERKIDKKSFLE